MMTLCRGGRDGAPSAIPIPRPFSGVFLPLVRGRLLRLICQNFGQISSLSSATREPRQRNKSPYAWKSCNRTNLGQVTGQWKFSNWEVPKSSRLICSFLVDKRQWFRFRDFVPIGTNVQEKSRKRPDLPLKSRSLLILSQSDNIPSKIEN